MISSCFGRVAVPLFFCISGYLCFSKNELNAKSLVYAYKKKIKTLVFPYLLWNVFYTLIFLILNWNTLDQLDNITKFLLESVFLYGSNGVLWYVFQLILLTVLSPLLFYIYKNKYLSIVFTVGSCFAHFFVSDPPIYLPLHGLAFYSIGATVSMHFVKSADSSLWTKKRGS